MPVDGYQGRPVYKDLPLGLDELAHGHASPSPEDFGVGDGGDADVHRQELPLSDTCRPEDPVELNQPRGEFMPNCEVAQKGIQTFSQWSDTAGLGTPSIWETYRMIRSPKVPGNLSALWMIDLWAYESLRVVGAAAGPVGPLSSAVITNTGGASASADVGSASSRLKARLMWWSSSGGTIRIIDIAQGVRCALEASLVTVEILYPSPGNITNVKNTETGAPSLAPTGGIVLDSVVGCAIATTTSTPGLQYMTNTFVVPVAAGVANVPVMIPPGARSVSIYQTRAGATMTPTWQFGREALLPVGEIGAIELGTDRRVLNMNRPGASGMILTGPADGQSDRLATFIFNLEI